MTTTTHPDALTRFLGVTATVSEGRSTLKADVAKQVMAAVTAAMKTGAGPGVIPMAAVRVGQCLEEAMAVRLREIVVSAWNKRKEIAKYADTAKYPAGQKYYVEMYAHPITWTYEPAIVITSGKGRWKLPLELKLTVKLDQASLEIDGGRVTRITPGKGTFEATARLGGFDLVPAVKKDLGEIPGSLDFKPDGYPLARARG